MTRARDRLSLSRHERVSKNRISPSPYHLAVTGHTVDAGLLPLPSVQPILEVYYDEPRR